jgi:putative phosphoesterase
MRYVLFSDIHGNYDALAAMIDELSNEKIDGYLFCGDLVGYYYSVFEIIDLFKKLPNFYAVKGNHDALYIEALLSNQKQQDAIKQFGSSYEILYYEVSDYLSTIPEIITKTFGNFTVTMIHGSPNDPLYGRIYPDTALDVSKQVCDFLLLGHTHYQLSRYYSNCKLINPGSLGQPRDGKGFAYCIIDFITGLVSRHSIKFDLNPLFAQISKRDPNHPYLSSVLLPRRSCL